MKYLLIPIVVLFAACSSKNYESEISEIEQTKAELVQATKKMDEMDTAKATGMYFDYERTVRVFKKYYSPDTIDSRLGRRMNLYKGIRKLANFPDQIRFYRAESDTILKQLDNLAHDLEHNLIPEDSVEYFINLEKNAVKVHISNIESMVLFLDEQSKNYDTLNPGIQIFVDSLLRVNNVSL